MFVRDIQWGPESPAHRHWWLILLLVGMALLFRGVGATSGLL